MADWKRISVASAISAFVFGLIMGKKIKQSPNKDVQDCMQDMIMCHDCRAGIKGGAAIFLARHMQVTHLWNEEVSVLATRKMIHRYFHNLKRKEKENAHHQPDCVVDRDVSMRCDSRHEDVR